MDGKGDGEQNGRDRPNFAMRLYPRGERPPADQLQAGLLAWLEFLLNNRMEHVEFAFLLDVLQNPEQAHNIDNNANPEDGENHDNNDNENMDNNENHDNNDNENMDNIENRDNNENHDNNVSNENLDNFDLYDVLHNVDVDENVDVHSIDNPNVNNADNNNGSREDTGTGATLRVKVGSNQGTEEEDPLPGGSRNRSGEEDGQEVDEISSKRYRWWDEFSGEVTSDSDSDKDDNNTRYSPDRHGGTAVAEEDPLLGPSRSRTRENVKVGDERSSKCFRWWDEFRDCMNDSDNDSPDGYNNNIDKNTGNSPVKNKGVCVAEEDPLPGSSKKSTRKSDKVENESNGNDSRQCYIFADSNSDTVMVPTGYDLAHSSSDTDLPEDAGAMEKTDEEVAQQMEEEDPQPGSYQNNSREDDKENEQRGSK